MATPLFVTDVATLQARLRLSGLASGSDGFKIFEAAILEAATGFIRALGLPAVVRVQGYNSTESPTTDQEAIRLIAEVTEVKWVRMILMRTMTMMTLDGSGGTWSDFHHEAPFRESGPFERDNEIKRIQQEIDDNLDLLALRESIGNEITGMQGGILESSEDPYVPGSAIFDERLF